MNPARPAEAVIERASDFELRILLIGGASGVLLLWIASAMGPPILRHRIRQRGPVALAVPVLVGGATLALFTGALWSSGFPIHVPSSADASPPSAPGAVDPPSGLPGAAAPTTNSTPVESHGNGAPPSTDLNPMDGVDDAYLAVNGDGWTLRDKVLHSSEKRDAILPLPRGPESTNYTLSFTVQRTAEPREALSVLLPMGDRLGVFYLDGYPQNGFASVLAHHRRSGASLPPTIKGLQIEAAASHRLEFQYRGDERQGELVVTKDDVEIYRWKGELALLRVRRGLQQFPAGKLGFSSHFPEWAISSIRQHPVR